MPLIPTWDWPDTQGAVRLTLIESCSQQHDLENRYFSLSRYVISFTAFLKMDHQNGDDTLYFVFLSLISDTGQKQTCELQYIVHQLPWTLGTCPLSIYVLTLVLPPVHSVYNVKSLNSIFYLVGLCH